MAQAVYLQTALTLLVAGLAALIGGLHAALSVALGGLACAVPNALFAARLFVDGRRPRGATFHGLFIGEAVKLAATVALLFLIAKTYRDVNWLALIVGIMAAQSYFLAFIFGRFRA